MNIPNALQRGSGGLKYYKYWTPGLSQYNTKESVLKAIELKLIVFRLDKTMNKTELFDYKLDDFKEISNTTIKMSKKIEDKINRKLKESGMQKYFGVDSVKLKDVDSQ